MLCDLPSIPSLTLHIFFVILFDFIIEFHPQSFTRRHTALFLLSPLFLSCLCAHTNVKNIRNQIFIKLYTYNSQKAFTTLSHFATAMIFNGTNHKSRFYNFLLSKKISIQCRGHGKIIFPLSSSSMHKILFDYAQFSTKLQWSIYDLHFIFAILKNVFPPFFVKLFGGRENSASMKTCTEFAIKILVEFTFPKTTI